MKNVNAETRTQTTYVYSMLCVKIITNAFCCSSLFAQKCRCDAIESAGRIHLCMMISSWQKILFFFSSSRMCKCRVSQSFSTLCSLLLFLFVFVQRVKSATHRKAYYIHRKHIFIISIKMALIKKYFFFHSFCDELRSKISIDSS